MHNAHVIHFFRWRYCALEMQGRHAWMIHTGNRYLDELRAAA